MKTRPKQNSYLQNLKKQEAEEKRKRQAYLQNLSENTYEKIAASKRERQELNRKPSKSFFSLQNIKTLFR